MGTACAYPENISIDHIDQELPNHSTFDSPMNLPVRATGGIVTVLGAASTDPFKTLPVDLYNVDYIMLDQCKYSRHLHQFSS